MAKIIEIIRHPLASFETTRSYAYRRKRGAFYNTVADDLESTGPRWIRALMRSEVKKYREAAGIVLRGLRDQ